MKRLSVQLSVVGAVLALGAAAIAYSVLSGPNEASARKEQADNVAKPESTETDSPSPIRVERSSEAETFPATDTSPPAEEKNTFRTVSDTPPSNGVSAGSRSAAAPHADMTSRNEDSAEYDSTLERTAGLDSRRSDTSGQTPLEDRSNSDSSYATPPAPTYGTTIASDGASQPSSRRFDEAGTGTQGTDGATAADVAERNMESFANDTGTGPSQDAHGEQASEASAFPLAFPADSRDPAASASPASLTSGSLARASGGASQPVHETAPPTNSGGGGSVPSANPAAASLGGGDTLTQSETRQPSSEGNGGPTPLEQGDSGPSEPSAERSRADPSGEATPTQPPSSTNHSNTDAGHVAANGTRMGTPTMIPDPDAGPSRYALDNSSSRASTSAVEPSGAQASSSGGYSSSVPSSAPATMTATGTGRPAASEQAAPMTSDEPGSDELEGEQAPAVTIEKSAPAEIQVNREATFELRVRNDGNAIAENVIVVDRVPKGTEFISATPSVTPSADGTISWHVGRLKPDENLVLSMRLLPRVAGEIGSVAAASFQARASTRTICTKPALELEVSAAQQVLIGESLTLEISVTNTGNGAAEDVVIDEDVPEGFRHPAGNKLEHELGTLRPGDSRHLSLELESVKQGAFENRMTVRGAGDLFDEDVRAIEITSPQLQVTMEGPTLRYLDRQATYAVELANPGTASAHNVELVTYLPKGMKYVTSDNHGQYDTQTHAVFWNLEELPINRPGNVHVTVLPIEPGNHKLKTDVKADLGLQEICEHNVVVEGSAELSFVISDLADPIEVGSETTYEVQVQNRGSKAGTQIRLALELPTGLTPSTAEGPTQGLVEGQQVMFNPLERLGPGEEVVFKIHAKGSTVGDHVVRAQLQTAELSVPVSKEEITRVYTDN